MVGVFKQVHELDPRKGGALQTTNSQGKIITVGSKQVAFPGTDIVSPVY